jgi:ribosome modulation factor
MPKAATTLPADVHVHIALEGAVDYAAGRPAEMNPYNNSEWRPAHETWDAGWQEAAPPLREAPPRARAGQVEASRVASSALAEELGNGEDTA